MRPRPITFLQFILFYQKLQQSIRILDLKLGHKEFYNRYILMLRLISKFTNSSFSTTTLSLSSPLATLTLSNPKKRNPLSLQTILSLQKNIDEVQSSYLDKKIKMLVIRGEGPVFSAGHDLKQLQSSPNPQKIFDQCTKMLLKLKNLPIPTLAVVNGVAAAAGFQLALTCDLFIATQKSTFSTPGVKWGLFCSTPAVPLLRSISSEKKARQMLIFGQPISAAQAFQYGLLNKVAKDQTQLQLIVKSYSDKLDHLSGEVIEFGKKVLGEQTGKCIKDAYNVAGRGMVDNLKIGDCRQGLKAFAEKRSPKYTK